MRLRTFNAPDMPAAMKMVREALGSDAVILATETQKGKGVRVTAAVDSADAAPVPSVGQAAEHLRFELQEVLRFHNLPDLFFTKMMRQAAESKLRPPCPAALEQLLEIYFSFEPIRLDEPGLRLMLVGPPGIGKTLTIARLAARLTIDRQKPQVITTDNKRAGGIEQLQAFTAILGINLHVAESRAALRALLSPLPSHTPVLVDTAGCNPYDKAELDELSGFATIEGIEPALTLPAGGDSLETIDIVENFMQMPIKRLLVTRADTARRFGGILAAAAAHRLAFCNISSSSSIADPLQPASGALLAQHLLRYQLHSE